MDEQLRNAGKTPISEQFPAGEEAKYDDDYESMLNELGKLEAVSSAEPINWQTVVDLSSTIIINRSKDIVAACYLCHALYQKQGLKGLEGGLNIVADMLETFYENMFPPVRRVKARANAISWLAEKTEPLITALDPKASELDTLASCLNSINRIQTCCDEKMQDNGPSIGAFKRAVRNWHDHLKAQADKKAQQQAPVSEQQTAAKNEQAATKPATPAAPSIAAATAPVEIADDKDIKLAVKSIIDVSRKVAQFKRQQNPADANAYSLLRTAIWLQIERLPPNDKGMTQLPEIEQERQKLLQNLLENGAFNDLLNAAENAFCDSMFWLDAHRYAATALEGLGHKEAQQAVLQSTLMFVNRFPQITELKFNTGTPFANDMTKLWLQDNQSGGANSNTSNQQTTNPWDTTLQQAMPLAAKGKIAEGLQLFESAKQQARDERDRFMWQLTTAQFLEKCEQSHLAAPQLEYLWQQLQTNHLTEWESVASVGVARSLKDCYLHKNFKNKMTPERQAHIEELESVIYRLDISTALMQNG